MVTKLIRVSNSAVFAYDQYYQLCSRCCRWQASMWGKLSCPCAGGGAATFDNQGVPTGKAHPANQPKAASASAGAYPTSGSSVTDPRADLTSPAGAPYATLNPSHKTWLTNW